MVLAFKKEMFFELVCFWPPDEAKKLEEQLGFLLENETKERKSISNQSKGPPKAARGKPSDASMAPPKASRGQKPTDAPLKVPRGKASSNSSLVASSKPKTLVQISKQNDSDNPFLDDADDDNPFIDNKPSNPFEDNEQPNPLLNTDTSNPFLDDDDDDPKESSNPFLD